MPTDHNRFEILVLCQSGMQNFDFYLVRKAAHIFYVCKIVIRYPGTSRHEVSSIQYSGKRLQMCLLWAGRAKTFARSENLF